MESATKYYRITEELTMVDEGHLGGFIIENDPATFTPILWSYICAKYNIKSVLDLGCGMGYSLNEFKSQGAEVLGLDGSDFVIKNSPMAPFIKKIDFSKESFTPEKYYDLTWSSEFVEHVEEQFIDNFKNVFLKSKYCAITYGDVGQTGHHHVNCQPKKYWVEKFESWGFELLESDLDDLKNVSYQDAVKYNPIYKDNHFYLRGLFFKNNNLN
jgi:SAM-dependent methyltransferase